MRRLIENARRIRLAYHTLSRLAARHEPLPAAAEWLLDNYYVIDQVVRQVRKHLPRSFYRELPAHGIGSKTGWPRVYLLASTVLENADGAVTENDLLAAVRAYEQVSALTTGELWALPAVLRLATVETLRRLADQLLDTVTARRAATTVVAARRYPKLPAEPSDAFAAAVWESLRDAPAPDDGFAAWIADHLADPTAVVHREFVRQAATQVAFGNAVTTLRLLGVIDWRRFFEAVSVVESTLRTDPGGVYASQDFPTRDVCRRAVERLARGSEQTEAEVAAAAVASAWRHAGDPIRGQVSWFLIGGGEAEFALSLGYRPTFRSRVRTWVNDHPGLMYAGLLVGFTALGLTVAAMLLASAPWPLAVLALLLALFPAAELAVGLTNFAVSKLVPPRVLPKREFAEGIPDEFATFVVVPTLIARPDQAADLIERLERHHLSNPDPALWYALLTDFTDAASETLPVDEVCVAALRAGVKRLNKRFAADGPPRFFFFHRRRRWNPREGVWMGWERKRGKLHEFNRLVRGASDTDFTAASHPPTDLPRVRFVLTLDTDTVLPRDAAKQMIAAMAHPLNRPRLSADGRRVEAGYAVLQPRVNFLYRVGFRSWFARAFAGSAGVDPYSSAASDTYMDLFARGTFTGKGLYDVDAFAATAGAAFPDDTILSHDLIESNYARCALASDVEVFDDFPTRYHAYVRREHRWIRGDWQLLPWLGFTVPTPSGRQSNPLPLLERWKVIDNLRRSLVPPAALLLLAVAWAVLPGPAWAWTLLVVAPWLLPSLLLVWETAPRVVFGPTRRGAIAQAKFDVGNTVGQAGLQLAFLADQARLAADAVGRTLYRLGVSRRHLLEWETAAAADRRLGNTRADFWRIMWPAVLIAAAVTALLAVVAPTSLIVAGPLLLAWLLSPGIAYWVSRPRLLADPPLTPEVEAELRRVARSTWGFFQAHVCEVDHWLPPDNFQEDPLGVVAHRTSPTNIGLYLLVVMAAHEFGYVTRDELTDRLTRAFDTLDKLERYAGHFLNWYETTTLTVLPPGYVSTVDSGNLLACFLALKNGLRGKKDERLEPLAARAERLAADMDFRFLYNPERELFSIGFNAATGRLDSNHYDLLASEACIASFLAVARGQVPRKHWFQLGRLSTRVAGETGLISWGGTLFEYLMPRLLLPVPPGALLDQAQRAAVHRQMEYGKEIGLPWGVSESGFALLDAWKVYQYQSFGVPALGLKRGLDRDRVVAPYASLLAADVEPAAAVRNFAALRAAGGEGALGFYEAIDYAPERAGPDGPPTVVKSYMAHHQGMGFLAIFNRLTGGTVRGWLGAEPAVRAAELLLEERVPYDAVEVGLDEAGGDSAQPVAAADFPTRRRLTTADTPTPRTHLLSNGRYSLMVTNAGGGYSRCGELDITRWRADATVDADGQFVYVRDRQSGDVWSAAHQPICRPADWYEVTYSLDKAEFRRADGEVETLLEITVVPGEDVEVRRVMLTNAGRDPREFDITSYAEVVLAPHTADLAHPAFHKLFLETEWLPDRAALVCRRRPRAADEGPVFAVHVLSADPTPGGVSYETDRAAFLGRRRTPADPVALEPTVRELAGGVGPVLDPVFAVRRAVTVPAGGRVTVAFATGFAATREQAVAIVDRYHTPAAVTRGFELAWAHARIELQGMHLKAEEVNLFQRLGGHLLYPTGPLRADADTLAANRLGQAGLWAFGISGDLPILVVRVHGPGGMPHLKQAVQAHAFWQTKGLRTDLVALLENAGGYFDELHAEAVAAVRSAGRGDQLDRPGGVFVRKGWQMTDPERTLLLAAARVVLDDRVGPVAGQAESSAPPAPLPPRRPVDINPTPARFARPPVPDGLQFDSAYGGFTSDGREFVVQPGRTPPAPWANVIANPDGGLIVTDSGGGYVWAGNSQSNRLTPWSNDPVADPPGDVIYLHDDKTGRTWCPTPLPVRDDAPVTVRHGQGYTMFERVTDDLASELTVFVPVAGAVKVSILKVRNGGKRPRRLTVAYFADWVLGTVREATAQHVVTSTDPDTGAVFARNPYHPDYGSRVAFADASFRPRTVTGDRAEFLGRNSTQADPQSFDRVALSGTTGSGLDPCAAVRGGVTLGPGEERTLVFVLGQAADADAARKLLRTFGNPAGAAIALAAVVERWERLCGAVQVASPDSAFDLLMNRWLVYQTLSCRVWGRSAFYQSGGAWGFRDQLQDVCALVYCAPEEARAHLLRAAARQFAEGNVQHWWHEPAGNGVRTRFRDDFLWLPYAVCHYVEVTGDLAVLDEPVPFLDAPPLKENEYEVYGVPAVSARTATLFDHCRMASEYGWQMGPHGLPLMGGGDWNDGMNTVGAGGTGESVWLAWFQIAGLTRFAEVADRRGEAEFARTCRGHAAQLREAAEAHAWDGGWYRRAYFDDGTPLGSKENDECRIDSLAQSWAVIANGDTPRAAMAMDAVNEHLIRPAERLVLLFDPPFDAGPLRPGYIKGYLPGVRENGGQYTHAAAWVVKALAGLGRGNEAFAAFDLLNPIRMPADRYRGEPYVLAGDVYSRPPHVGRAGWTWYTGAAGWVYRVGLEDLIGLRCEGNRLRFDPCVPSAWARFTVRYRHGGTVYHIEFVNPQRVHRGVVRVSMDGVPVAANAVELVDSDGERRVEVELGSVLPDGEQADARTDAHNVPTTDARV